MTSSFLQRTKPIVSKAAGMVSTIGSLLLVNRSAIGQTRTTVPMLEGRDVQAMWNARTKANEVPCRRCSASRIALSIGDLRSYRWRCMACGAQSSWFSVTEDGAVRLHAVPHTADHGAPSESEP